MSRFHSPHGKAVQAREITEELQEGTLRHVDGSLAKLVYLSSCRDCNSGRYRHDGLTIRFSEPDVHEALARCHRELFAEMIVTPLAAWVGELRSYFTRTDAESLTVWKELRPYQIVVPLGTTTLAAALFESNMKIALKVLGLE